MTTGLSSVRRLYLMSVAALPPANAPVVCYLIQADNGKNILIDTGLPNRAQLPPGFEPVMGKNVIEQLALIGLQPDDIDTVIYTHFDLDHSGHHGAFPDAEFIVQKSHYDYALNSPRFTNSRPYWETLHYRYVDGDTELQPGIELIQTSGHTLGHQSVLVRLPESGSVLLAIDAVGDQASFSADREIHPYDEDAEAVRTSTHKLLKLARHEQVSLVIFGHDREQWETLKKVPEYYG